jgi:hypothetical protein
MEFSTQSFVVFLSILWFIVYWILGGVFFAALTILRLGRVRKVRFSCLFTILAAICGLSASHYGMKLGEGAIVECTKNASGYAETISAIFGCGFSAVFGAFLIGAAVLTFGGLFIMSLSKSKSKPWITFSEEETEEEVGGDGVSEKSDVINTGEGDSKFF